MIKKFGTVAVGVTAGLLTMAPLASAHEGHGHHGHGGHDSIDCSAEGGDVEGNTGESLGLGLGSAADGNAGQLLSCNSFLNDNGNDNEIGISVLGGDDDLPGLP